MTEPVFIKIELPSKDNDINGLAVCIEGMEITSERMRRATIDYLISRYLSLPQEQD